MMHPIQGDMTSHLLLIEVRVQFKSSPPLVTAHPPSKVTLHKQRHERRLRVRIEVDEGPPAYARALQTLVVGLPEHAHEPPRGASVDAFDAKPDLGPADAAGDSRREGEREGGGGEEGDGKRGQGRVYGRREKDLCG